MWKIAMLILYCEKCGMRIPQAMLDAMGVKAAELEKQYFCTSCVPPAQPHATSFTARASGGHPAPARSSGLHPASSASSAAMGGRPASGGVRVMQPTSGFAHAVKPPTAARIKRVTENLPRRQQAGAGDPPPAPSSPTKWIMLASGGVVLLVVAGLFVFGGGKKPETTVARDDARAAELIPDKMKAVQPTNPPAPIQTTPPVQPHKPEPEKHAEAGTPQELSPKEFYEQRVKEGKIKPVAPATPPSPAASAPVPANDASLLEMTDSVALREKLTPLRHDAPIAAIKHLGDLAPPAIPETIVYKSDFPRNDAPSWQSDYSSKITPGTFEGEAGIKTEGGSDRLGCYRNFDFATNHTQLKLRIFQKGCTKIQISIKTVFAHRFNTVLTLPSDGKWTDVSIDAGKLTSEGVKSENMPIQHLEIHGFRPANSGAYFVISKFEIVNGAK
jgi:hypothetical protein